jgi:AraC-like DNA-binding protein
LINVQNINQVQLTGMSKTTSFLMSHEHLSLFAHRYSGTPLDFAGFSAQTPNQRNEIGSAVTGGFRLLDRLFSLENEDSISEYSVAAMQEASLSVLCEYLAREVPDRRDDRSPASTVQMHRIVDYIVSSARPVLVSEVADHAGISMRALQLSFMRHHGVSPHVFIKRARLSALRTSLVEGGSGRLPEMAAHWGFANRSRLKKDFIELFGETEWRRVAEAADDGA